MEKGIKFEKGANITVKIPKYLYESILKFYRDILKLEARKKLIDNPTKC